MLEASPLPSLLIRTADRSCAAVNDAYIEGFGWLRDELLGESCDRFWVVPDQYAHLLERLRLDGRVRNSECLARRKSGEQRNLLVSLEPIVLAGEQFALTMLHDVTEQRAIEQSFTRAFAASPQPQVITRARDRVFVAINDAFERTFGYARHEIVGRRSGEIEFYVDADDRAQMLEDLAATGLAANQELQVRTRAGKVLDIVSSAVIVHVDGERCVLQVATDVTDRKRAAAALEASELRFAKVFEANPLASAIVRVADYHCVAVNSAFCDLFGVVREDAIGRPLEYTPCAGLRNRGITLHTTQGAHEMLCSGELVDISGEPHLVCVFQDITERKRAEDALRQSESRFRDLAETIREVFWLTDPTLQQMLYISPAYETVWGRSCASLVERPLDWIEAIHPEDRERVAAAATAQLETGTYYAQYRIVRPDGTLRWIRDRGFPVRDAAGAIIRLAGVAEDVTDQLALEDQLRQTQKMESLGLLAGGVAHDFNNILTVISSSAGMLSDELPKESSERELVDEIDQAVSRAIGLTRQLLAFSRRQVVEPKVVDTNAIVQETRKMLRRMMGEDVILTTSLEPELWPVRIDPGCLVQVLLNLSVNARDAMPQGGTLSVTSRNVVHSKCGAAIALAVTDSGHGIPDEVKAHIFEPFFTTKSLGKGTGMGLSVVLGIVDQAGGAIDVESSVGVGTTFTVYLPRVDAPVDSLTEIGAALAVGTETVALVDDDDHVRRVAARALRKRGFNVIEAGSGATALQLLASSRVDLLVTDVVMPGMDGRELAAAARSTRPDLKVLYCSGYTDDAVVRHGVMQGEVELIEKPFRIDALASKVRQVLDA